MTPTAALQAALADLDGPTIGPADPGYVTAKTVYIAMIDKSRALTASAKSQQIRKTPGASTKSSAVGPTRPTLRISRSP